MKKIGIMIGTAAAMLALTGCSAPAYDVEVFLSPKVREKYQVRPSLEVDIAGLDHAAEEHFAAVDINDYFSPDNALRSGSAHATLHFSEEDGAPKRLAKSDPIWAKFAAGSADKICLLVNLPTTGGKKQKNDPRKIVIPLEDGIFKSSKRYFEITPSGLIQLKGRPEYAASEIKQENTEKRP